MRTENSVVICPYKIMLNEAPLSLAGFQPGDTFLEAYEGNVELDDKDLAPSVTRALGMLFAQFNLNHPDDYLTGLFLLVT